jgi:hypothetical protein
VIEREPLVQDDELGSVLLDHRQNLGHRARLGGHPDAFNLKEGPDERAF